MINYKQYYNIVIYSVITEAEINYDYIKQDYFNYIYFKINKDYRLRQVFYFACQMHADILPLHNNEEENYYRA